MNVFVTGASGHIGSALIPELLEAGHTVVGLARSYTSASADHAFRKPSSLWVRPQVQPCRCAQLPR